MRKLVPLVVALIISLSAHAQESETVLYERLGSLASEVVSEYLNGSLCSPGPDLAKKQVELAEAVSKATPSTGPLVLEIAVMANSLSDVRRLQEGGAIPLSPSGTLLHTAATFGSPAMLEYLVGEGFGLEDIGEASAPALLVAVQAGNIDNIKWLIANGANVNAMDTSGGPVIQHSIVCGDQAVVDLLLKSGAVPSSKAYEAAQRLGISLGPD
jgi:ankyrin repeat protein